MLLETLTSFLIFTINPSISFHESNNAMPFSEPKTKIDVERASASIFGIENMMIALFILLKIFLVVF
jgi:hypothetical protein